MPAQKNKELVSEFKEILKEKGNFILTTYSGLNVEVMSEIRREIRGSQGRLKVIKNNLFKIALDESDEHKDVANEIEPVLKGPLAVTFSNGNFPALSKLMVRYAKELEQIEVLGGCMDGRYLQKSDVIEIATLPSREELLAIIGRGLNTPATKIATGINQILAGLARGIKAVGEKNG